jgi:hypothetical protein
MGPGDLKPNVHVEILNLLQFEYFDYWAELVLLLSFTLPTDRKKKNEEGIGFT